MESEDECEVELEYEVATPRLQTPFYEALRKKYPKAFRRRTSISSDFSDTASVVSFASDFSLGPISLQSASNTPRHKRPRAIYRDQTATDPQDGLPPRPPVRPRKKPNIESGVVGSVRRLKIVKSSNDSVHIDTNSDADGNTSNNASNVELPVDKTELVLDLRSLAASDLNNSMESLDNLDDPQSVSECESNLRKSHLNMSMSSLLSEQQLTSSWRRNCRLVKRSFNSSTQSLHGDKPRPLSNVIDMQKLTDSMQDLRRRVRENQDRFRQILDPKNRPVEKLSRQSSAGSISVTSSRRRRAFAARQVDVVTTSTPRGSGDGDALLRQLQGKLRSASASSVTSSVDSQPSGDVTAASKSDGFMCSAKPDRPNKPLSKLRSGHYNRQVKGQSAASSQSGVNASRAVANDISVTIYPSAKPTLPPKKPALVRLKAKQDSVLSTNEPQTNSSNGYTRKESLSRSEPGDDAAAPIHKLVSHFRATSQSKAQPSGSSSDVSESLQTVAGSSRPTHSVQHALDVAPDVAPAAVCNSTTDMTPPHSVQSAPDVAPAAVYNSTTDMTPPHSVQSAPDVAPAAVCISQAFVSLHEGAVQAKSTSSQVVDNTTLNDEVKSTDESHQIKSQSTVVQDREQSTADCPVDVKSSVAPVNEVTSSDTSCLQSSASANSRLHKLRSRQKSHERTGPGTSMTPVRADHSIQALVSPRGDSSETESVSLASSMTSPTKSALKSRPRSASADTRRGASPRGGGGKRDRVLFEDEVGGSIVRQQRAVSQPVLNDIVRDGGNEIVPLSVLQTLSNALSASAEHLPMAPVTSIASGSTKIRTNHVPADRNYDNVQLLTMKGTVYDDTTRDNEVSSRVVDTELRVSEALPPKPSVDVTSSSSSRGRSRTKQNKSIQPSPAAASDAEADLATEVSMLTSILDGSATAGAGANRKSKLPWRKNKGRYTPSEELERVEQNVVTSLSRTSSWSSLYTAGARSAPVNDTPRDGYGQQDASRDTEKPNSVVTGLGASIDKTPTKPPRPNKGKKLRSAAPGAAGVTSSEAAVTSADYEEIELRNSIDDVDDTADAVDALYATVNKVKAPVDASKGDRQRHSSHAGAVSRGDDVIRPPAPYRSLSTGVGGSSSDLNASRGGGGSIMGNLRNSARRSFGKLRKAFSLERLSKDDDLEKEAGATTGATTGATKLRKAPSLRGIFSKKETSGSYQISEAGGVEAPTNFRQLGQIKAVTADGAHIIELRRPPHGPYGFYIARGTAKYNHGIFVSRFSDGAPQHFFGGLLSVGDEIKSINGKSLARLDVDRIYELINDSDRLELVVVPHVSSKDT